MGAAVDGDFSGFLITDVRLTRAALADIGAGATDSSYTQGGARPGSAVPSDARTSITPRVHAAQDADLEIVLPVGGVPGGSRDGASIAYRVAGEADTSYRGWNEPNFLSHYVPIAWTSTENWVTASARTVPSTGQVVVAAVDSDGNLPASTWTWDPLTRTWGSRVAIHADETSLAMVALCVHPRTGRVYAILPLIGGFWPTRVYYSDDAGATWTPLTTRGDVDDSSRSALLDGDGRETYAPLGADYATAEFDKLGNVMLILTDSGTGDWWTFVSRDDCATFVANESGTELLGPCPNLSRFPDGRLLLTYVKATADSPYSQTLEDAYDQPNEDIDVALSTGIEVGGDPEVELVVYLVSCVDDDGVAYAVARPKTSIAPGAPGVDKWPVLRSTDAGASWSVYGSGDLVYYAIANDAQSGAVYDPVAMSASGGELVAVAATGITTAMPGSLVSLVLGGWGSLEMGGTERLGRQSFGEDNVFSVPLARTFLPGILLAGQGWTHTGAVATLVNGYHRYAPAAAQSYDTYAPNISAAQHIAPPYVFGMFYEIDVVTGSTANDQAVVRIRASDTVNDDQWFSVRHSATGYVVRDVHAGTTLATVTVDLTTLTQFAIIRGQQDVLTVLHKKPSSDVWVIGYSGAVSNTGVAGAASAIDVGAVTAASPDFTIGSVRWARFSADVGIGQAVAELSTNCQPLAWGKSLNSYPYPIRDLGDSTRMGRVTLAGGAGRTGETFEVPAVYDFGVDKALPIVSPSPRSGWRTTQTASNEGLVFDLEVDTHFDHSRTFALFVAGLHTPQTITVERRADGAGAWTLAGTYNGAVGFEDVPYELNGNVVRCAGSAAIERYCWGNEWRGGYAILDTGGTPVARSILSNTPGYWTQTADTPKMEIRLDGIDGTEAASGDITLVHPSGVLVIPGSSAASYFRRLRITVPGGQVVPDDYYHLGVLALGGVLIPGHQPGRNWTRRHTPRTRETEDDYGTPFVSKRGPIRREYTWSYQDGNNLYPIRNGTDPNFVRLHSTGHIEAAHGDVEYRLVELLDGSQGGAVPVVALLQLPDSSTPVTYTDPTLFVYGRVTGTVQKANVVGAPGRGELERAESMTLTEIPWDRD